MNDYKLALEKAKTVLEYTRTIESNFDADLCASLVEDALFNINHVLNNLIEYETEETINFVKPLDNETLTKYIYRLNREISDLHKEIVNLHMKIDSLIS